MIDPELIQRLEERYAEPEIPPCRVCGEELKVSKMGGGEATVFHCGSPHADWLFGEDCKKAKAVDPSHKRGWGRESACEHFKHYLDSEWKLYRHGDPDVRELVEYIKSLSPVVNHESLERWEDEGGTV